ncbi:DNA repair protein RadC [Aequitasia blattaphilus]|uniref:DNA repair protein RadC n=1 Tax=Aequitasia blattaphilus TaxID=2949332 RepID=A0ABT1EA03_9FIRM|nr:DNA repair protein RadC [Aequitasia blattaphilus]MCP1101691.1 DNA repair protein RadC [Aequitasia blattaphilus]MCR8614331.1 DNA repair protein RadC [Aequitasia blattaphilus]
MKQSNIKGIHESERPYEKCLKHGVSALTDAELLAVLLRSGTSGINVLDLARSLLYQGSGDGILSIHHYNYETLIQKKGIGHVKAVQILCLSEFTRRLSQAKAKEPLCFTNPSTIASYYMEELRHKKQEQVKLLMLNTKAGLIGERDIFKGTVNASMITPRELFIEALKSQAVSIILIHNHPSGDPTPSSEDIVITKRIEQCGKLIGIDLLDHIIIGDKCYVSLRQKNLL